MQDKHGWNSWQQYLAIHTRCIENYMGHFILDDQLTSTLTRTQAIWQGTLYCVNGVEIRVRKLQDVQSQGGRYQVRTRQYSYHVLRQVGNRAINWLRYDNVHAHPGHSTPHHLHRYDADGVEVGIPTHVGAEGWPTLSEVIAEVHDLWASRQAKQW